MRPSFVVLLASLLLGSPSAVFAAGLTILAEGPAPQEQARSFLLHSERIGRDVLVEVTPPPVAPTDTRRFPVVYALDAGLGVVGPMGRLMGLTGAMKPAVMVTIGYQPKDYRFRDQDMLHKPAVRNGRTIGGGGAAFEAFLLEDLRPFIDSHFATDPQAAILFGHSNAGAFVANVMSHDPAAFAGYVIASPSLAHDPEAIAAVARTARDGAGRRVFLTAGGAETPDILSSVEGLRAALTGPNASYEVTTRVFQGETHGSYFTQMVTIALPALLPPATR